MIFIPLFFLHNRKHLLLTNANKALSNKIVKLYTSNVEQDNIMRYHLFNWISRKKLYFDHLIRF